MPLTWTFQIQALFKDFKDLHEPWVIYVFFGPETFLICWKISCALVNTYDLINFLRSQKPSIEFNFLSGPVLFSFWPVSYKNTLAIIKTFTSSNMVKWPDSDR